MQAVSAANALAHGVACSLFRAECPKKAGHAIRVALDSPELGGGGSSRLASFRTTGAHRETLLDVTEDFLAGEPHKALRKTNKTDAALAHHRVNCPLADSQQFGALGLGEKFRLCFVARTGGGFAVVWHGNRRWPAAHGRRMRVVRFAGSYRLSDAHHAVADSRRLSNRRGKRLAQNVTRHYGIQTWSKMSGDLLDGIRCTLRLADSLRD